MKYPYLWGVIPINRYSIFVPINGWILRNFKETIKLIA